MRRAPPEGSAQFYFMGQMEAGDGGRRAQQEGAAGGQEEDNRKQEKKKAGPRTEQGKEDTAGIISKRRYGGNNL